MKIKIIIPFVILIFLAPITPAQNEKKFLEVAKSAEIIAVAEVIEKDDMPTFWSGLFPSTQQVKYKVIKTLKGDIESKEILVGHYVVANSYTADVDEPMLSPKLFKAGNKLIVLMSSEENTVCKKEKKDQNLHSFCSSNENFGVRPFTENLSKLVEQAIQD